LGGSHKVAVDELNVNLYETTEKAALKLRHSEAQIKDLEKKVWPNAFSTLDVWHDLLTNILP